MPTTTETDATLVIERRFDAPPSLVFLAWSRPEHVKRWFGPPGYPLTKCEMDFRVGGQFDFQMTGPDGTQGPPFGGEYLAIEENALIRYTNGFKQLPDPSLAGTMVVTVEFLAEGEGTLMRQSTRFESQAMHDAFAAMGQREGTNASFDQLVEVVAGLKAAQ